MNVRFLAADGREALRARFGDALAASDAEALAGAAGARILAVDGPLEPAVLAALRGAGIAVARAGETTLAAGSRAAFERAGVEPFVAALARAEAPVERLAVRGRIVDLRDEAAVMGIVNVTPDSFYERVDGAEAAAATAAAMARDGAAFVDVGGQSYAAGNRLVTAEEERDRVVPAIRAIVASGCDAVLSVDTFKATVADAALAAGAHLVNDCSGLSDPALAEVVARHGAGLVVMHLKGRLAVREPASYVYRDALAEIVETLHATTERALREGVARDALVVDPGLEFGKEPETDLEILERFGELRALGYPILFASSRKSFIGRIFGRPARDLLVPSLATAAIGIAAGARIVRVHDVPETVQLARMLAAVAPGRRRAAAGNSRAAGTG